MRYNVANSAHLAAVEVVRVVRVNAGNFTPQTGRDIGTTGAHLGYYEHLPVHYSDDPTETSCSFKARLQVLGVVREDVGQGRDYKQAATDAFKRAAVRFGIAHELYSYGTNWVELDGDGKFAKPLEDRGLPPGKAETFRRRLAWDGLDDAGRRAPRRGRRTPRRGSAVRWRRREQHDRRECANHGCTRATGFQALFERFTSAKTSLGSTTTCDSALFEKNEYVNEVYWKYPDMFCMNSLSGKNVRIVLGMNMIDWAKMIGMTPAVFTRSGMYWVTPP